uniref:Uncharacterized protein n=1 Tax=Trichogramma kaykai TaxID=54128 RepID=A0ABD2X521_9HYME
MTAQVWSNLMSIAGQANEEEKRRLLLDGIYRVVENWQGPLPNLLEIFRPEQIERLLSHAVTDREGSEEARMRFIKFVVDTGYRDQPKVGTDRQYVLHRTTPIHLVSRAQVRGSSVIVHLLFEIYDRFDLNYVDDTGFTHLHAACSIPDGQGLVVKFLEQGQDPNVVVRGQSLLRTAVQNDWRLAAAELLRRGADPTQCDDDGSSALHAVCRYGRADFLKLFFEIVDEHGKPFRVNLPDGLGNTPLHLAVENGNVATLVMLLTRGADPNLANREGSTPLHAISRRTNNDYLIEALFRISDENRRTVRVNVSDRRGDTLLHLALESGNLRMSEILLTRGADVNSVNKKGLTPLHLMCQNTEADLLVENFFAINARLNKPVLIDARDKLCNTPLHLATLYGRKKATELLLRAGADPNLANGQRSTPLHIICRRSDGCDLVEAFFKIVRELGKPVQIDARDESCNTPLHLTLRHRSTRMFWIMLVNGADPNLADNDGCTALHHLCHVSRTYGTTSRFFEIVDKMRRTVQLDARDNAGWTPLHVAVRARCKSKFQTLLRRGANPNVANRAGQTALHFLVERIHDEFMWCFFAIVGDARGRPVLIDARDTKGRTPLHVALFAKNTRAARRLLWRGANPNLADADGWTPLHVICIECNWFLQQFFEINAESQQPVEINAKTNEGRTPLSLLRDRKPIDYEEASRYLEALGAELD